MAEVIRMPKLSDTMEEGVIASWSKKEGESIEEGDILAEIETDKATMEYESPETGVILKIVAKEGTKLNLGEAICVIGEEGEKVDEAALAAAASVAEPAKADAPASAPAASAPAPTAALAASAPATSGGGRVRSSPLARKIASDKGISLSGVAGSGPGGRIVARDLEGAASGGGSVSSAGAIPSGEDRVVTNSMMRQTIAKRLHAAKNDAPHFYLTVSANMAKVISWRKKLNGEVEKNPDLPKVSVNDIVMQAAAKALARHPNCNASWEGETIREFGNVHMAMAVALPDGLITPVIRNCDKIGLRNIARTSRALATKAKGEGLQPDEYTGSTFTISNLGMFGIEEFTAIINPPQAGIIAVGGTIPTPWVGADGEVEVQPRMKMTMSCDHRVIDGAAGAQFLQTLVGYLEDPMMMLE